VEIARVVGAREPLRLEYEGVFGSKFGPFVNFAFRHMVDYSISMFDGWDQLGSFDD